MEKKSHHIYSSKFNIIMLQLNQLGNPIDEEQIPEICHWCNFSKIDVADEQISDDEMQDFLEIKNNLQKMSLVIDSLNL